MVILLILSRKLGVFRSNWLKARLTVRAFLFGSLIMISSLVVRSVSVSRQAVLPVQLTMRSISQCPSSVLSLIILGRSSMLGRFLCTFRGLISFFRGFRLGFSHKSAFRSVGNTS